MVASHDVSEHTRAMTIPDDYTAARLAAAVAGLGHRGRIVVRGADRKSFLHAVLTNDIAGLASGSGCYTAFLTPQGRMVADMNLFDLGDAALIDTPAGAGQRLLERLDQLIFSEDVQLGDVSEAWGCLGVYGPRAAEAAGAAIGADLAAFAPFQNARLAFRGDTLVAARRDGLGLTGFLLFAAAGQVEALEAALAEAGAVRMSAATAEVLRVEAGEPAFPADMDEATIPLEAGIEGRAVSFTKGCFPGQEVLVRIRDRGHGRIARKLVGVALDGSSVPSPGSPILAGDKEAGRVTSAVMSPALGRPVALGYVHRDLAEPGTAVAVASGAGPIPGTVTALPFVTP